MLKQVTNDNWVIASRYADLLKRWFNLFDRKKILVLSYDELKDDPGKVQWRIRKFLGGTFPGELGHLNTKGSMTTKEVSPKAKEILGPIFSVKNEELYDLLVDNKGPWMEQSPFPHFKDDSD